MNKEELILKWLDNDLSPKELQAFEALEDYESLTKLAKYSKGFKAPEFDTEAVLETTLRGINAKKSTTKKWFQPMLKVAAILAICLGIYYYTTTLDHSFTTDFAEKSSIELPDHSLVHLNAISKISFNKKNWNTNRTITLDGEAFFKVEKGSTFHVKTDAGTITVLGTQFNVKQREDYFEVVCYEGSVQINYNTGKSILKAGDSFLILNGKVTTATTTFVKQPEWLSHISAFSSVPLNKVLEEFERQYHVQFDTTNIETNTLYTGKFTHKNIDIALKSITQPLQLSYTKTNKTIILSRE
ncbi:FecR family protein [Lacinutrix sp. C3R15]|uniref:FecR family protein n=1 Tax=Flavobacteriaceae TaxID=49546 RepID=UPI001C0910E6|nr:MULTISPECIES: FecR family protein [Flavobacteriaceae]MBU2941015.1 FecR family protein [Lacinutrix sp. C3R15]MDO6624334.1 FecR family protein [Oceanihabitans sp. 1_MG-2023]